MLNRKVERELEAWHAAPQRTALLVTGVRQIGKTYIIRHFAASHYDHVAELNFIENPRLVSLFSTPRDAKNLLMRLELAVNTPLVPGKTLIFFDEVQECKELVTAIKFLVDDGRFDYALSGSLLGVELEDVRSVPVGYVTEVDMYPLDFEEFCWSRGVGADVFAMLHDHFVRREPVDSFIHDRLMDLYANYLVIGGMPAAVASFAANGSVSDVRTIQENIKREYRRDISKYARKEDRLHIRSIYDLVPSELNNANKRFTFSKIDKGLRFKAVAADFDWLVAAGVTIAAYNVNEPCVPLEMSKERNLFKLFYNDVGLLTSSFLKKTSLDVLDGNPDVNYGAIYENAMAQELSAHGFGLYYFNSKKWGELDFLVQDRNDVVVPIEVKSGKSYKRHRAMDNVLAQVDYHLDGGYVFGPCNVSVEDKVTYLPIYMAGLLSNE
ncbi:ATP-binding protein [Bifidobacterium avesanii]|uniref:AAA family ATPase n=1 Tax=Bifidobacterium avesanii TaxID=1798157 RepID=A0A7K3TIC2_9BIFI|nr:AAA family ATPase [Bifidobacterium avesanii]KAB8291991.1 ATPase AAA [Bifidobacterium avesanii]NEG78646.1 AAA family ATPase [Bifidobacterium avesanii]